MVVREILIAVKERGALPFIVPTMGVMEEQQQKGIRIKNTLELERMFISECLLEEAKANSNIEILSEPEYMSFNECGNLF